MSKRRVASTCARGFPALPPCLATLPPCGDCRPLAESRQGPFYDRRSITNTILF
jgi:hypothetical protein